MPIKTTMTLICDRCEHELMAFDNDEVVKAGWNFITFNASVKRYNGVLCKDCSAAFFMFLRV